MCETEMSCISMDVLLQNAIKPAGRTLYVWGGGWNAADDGSGETALHTGVWPEWKSWFHSHRKGYSYEPGRVFWEKGNREQRFFGLDCSGYIGWCVYNSVQDNRSRSGYVVSAEKMSASLEGYGYGCVKKCTPEDTFDPGDIVSLKGHCFICLGQCEDGSVVILHSTPNGGVQISGTVSEGRTSHASKLAADFMQRHYPDWWESFGCEGRQAVDVSIYLNGAKFSWNRDASMTDEKNMINRSAQEVIYYLENYENASALCQTTK